MNLSTRQEKLEFIAKLRHERLKIFSNSARGIALARQVNTFPEITMQQGSVELYDTIQALKALPRKREEESKRYLPRFVLSWALAVLSFTVVVVADISFLASVWFIALPVAVCALLATAAFLWRYVPQVRQTHGALTAFDKFDYRTTIEAVHYDDLILLDTLRDAYMSLGSEGHDMLQKHHNGDLKLISTNFTQAVVIKRREAQDNADGYYTKGAAATGLALGALAIATLPAIEFMLGTAVVFPLDIMFVAAVIALVLVASTIAACLYTSQYYVEQHKLNALDGAPVKKLEAQHSRMFQPVQLASEEEDPTTVVKHSSL